MTLTFLLRIEKKLPYIYGINTKAVKRPSRGKCSEVLARAITLQEVVTRVLVAREVLARVVNGWDRDNEGDKDDGECRRPSSGRSTCAPPRPVYITCTLLLTRFHREATRVAYATRGAALLT